MNRSPTARRVDDGRDQNGVGWMLGTASGVSPRRSLSHIFQRQRRPIRPVRHPRLHRLGERGRAADPEIARPDPARAQPPSGARPGRGDRTNPAALWTRTVRHTERRGGVRFHVVRIEARGVQAADRFDVCSARPEWRCAGRAWPADSIDPTAARWRRSRTRWTSRSDGSSRGANRSCVCPKSRRARRTTSTSALCAERWASGCDWRLGQGQFVAPVPIANRTILS